MSNPLLFSTALLTSALVLLTACGSQPTVLLSPTPTITPTPTPTLEPIADSPEPRFDLGCDDIASIVDFAVFPAAITLQDPASLSVSQGGYMYAPDFATEFETYGGLTCSWMDGLPEYFPSAQDRQYPDALLEVTVLPDAREFAASIEFPPRDSSLSECTNGYQNLCVYQKLVGDYWIEITTTGADAGDSVKVIADIEARVAALGPARAAWIPSPPAPALPASCDTVLDPVTVIDQYFDGVQLEPSFGSPIGHFGMELANAKLGSWTCTYNRPGDGSGTSPDEFSSVSVSVLPKAGWAVARYSNASGQVDSVDGIAIPGLAAESSSTACRPASEMVRCVLHMDVDGNWISVSVTGGPSATQAVVDVAAAVVNRVR